MLLYNDDVVTYNLHSQNDIWAETSYLGYYMSYMAMRHGVVYNVSDWILCQVSVILDLNVLLFWRVMSGRVSSD